MKFIGIYATDEQRNWTDPSGKCWNNPDDRRWFREQINDQIIICGRKTYEKDWRGFVDARLIIVLSHELKIEADYKTSFTTYKHKPIDALYAACAEASIDGYERIFCVGGKQTFEFFLPLMTDLKHTIIHADGTFTRERIHRGEKARTIPASSNAGSAHDFALDGHCEACEL